METSNSIRYKVQLVLNYGNYKKILTDDKHSCSVKFSSSIAQMEEDALNCLDDMTDLLDSIESYINDKNNLEEGLDISVNIDHINQIANIIIDLSSTESNTGGGRRVRCKTRKAKRSVFRKATRKTKRSVRRKTTRKSRTGRK